MSQLGIPTANIPSEGLSTYPDISNGVYYGFVGLRQQPNDKEQTYSAVLSIGYNPFYKNTVRSVEIHVLHEFPHDFYGAPLNLLILGFIRPEYDYISKESLIEDIRTDCDVALNSLERLPYRKYQDDQRLANFEWVNKVDAVEIEAKILARA